MGIFCEARDSEHDVILLHEVADPVAARENRSETSSRAEFARGLAGAQGKRQSKGGVLEKWNSFPFFFGRHHEAEQVTVASLTPASSPGSIDVRPDGLPQQLAGSCCVGGFLGQVTRRVNKLARIGSGRADCFGSPAQKETGRRGLVPGSDA